MAGPVRAADAAPPTQPPNIVLILADDLGHSEISCNADCGGIATPNIDRIAAEGIRFSAAYAGSMCLPSRAALLTGSYSQRFGSHAPLPARARTLAQHLQDAGYATGLVGKWHNTGAIGMWDGARRNHPRFWGFDEFFGFFGGMHDYFDPRRGYDLQRGRGAGNSLEMPLYAGEQIFEGSVAYLTDELSARGIDFLRRHAPQQKPFFLWLAYTAIHAPDQAPPVALAAAGGDVRKAMLASLDAGVGRVLAALNELGLERDTLVVFASDNGGYRPLSNCGLRGSKATLFEGGIRTPLLLRWPARFAPGRVYAHPVAQIDLLPTLLAAAGLEVPAGIDGADLLPHLAGLRDGAPHAVLYFEGTAPENFAVRAGDWKLIRESDLGANRPELALFDLASDPGETRNRLADEAGIAVELRAQYDAWSAQMKASRKPDEESARRAKLRARRERAHQRLLERQRPGGD